MPPLMVKDIEWTQQPRTRIRRTGNKITGEITAICKFADLSKWLPEYGEKYEGPVEFFGETAYIPTGYVRLPMRTDSLVMTIAAHYEDGAYYVEGNPPMTMVRTGDTEADAAVNLRRILDEIEVFVRRWTDQWMMFVPVWRNTDKEPDV